MSKLFQAERINLGKNFESELWKYLGNDRAKYYWSALFLESKMFLHGNPSSLELALAIREKILDLSDEPANKESLNYNPGKPDPAKILADINALMKLTITAEKLGRIDTAAAYKSRAETLVNANLDLRDFFPVLSDFDSCIYKNVPQSKNAGSARSKCKDNGKEIDEGRRDKEVVVNGKLLYVPKPVRNGQRESGSVAVHVLIDEEGNVISAEARSGPLVHYAASIRAAMKAKFSPTTFYGRPWIVTGIVVFNFE